MINVYILIIISIVCIIFFNYYLFLILKKFNFFKKIKDFLIYILSSFIVFIFLDFYVYKFFGHGFPSSISEERFERAPSPYDMFSGKPFYNDHNRQGFRGDNFLNDESDVFQIAFFGGSTGYNGSPPIPALIEKNLNNYFKSKVFNFSSVSSNHNQHLHRLLKYSHLNFDLVIFYGGYNETIQTYLYDPRPGYPFNYWIRDELSKIKYLLLKYSSIYAEYEKQTGNVSKLNNLRKNLVYPQEVWIESLLENYIDTLKKAKKLSQKFLTSNKCKSTEFMAFYQPISLERSNEISKKIIFKTIDNIKKKKILIDISYILSENSFTDSVHVNQDAKNDISLSISKYILDNTLNSCN